MTDSGPSPAGLDLDSLAAYLRTRGLAEGDTIEAGLISGGRSNLTYELQVDGHRWVLRRPPLGGTLATAHDMSREHRVMAALADCAVPVPEMVTLCEDASVLGAPFFVMHHAPGVPLRELAQLRKLTDGQRRDLYDELVVVLATLHCLDPREIGLADFGQPKGFVERQVRRWTAQLSATLEPTQAMRRLAGGLAATLPPDTGTGSVLHGDYRLDNCLAVEGRITSVLDWELSTLGDPLSDLATFAVYHDGLADLPNPVVQAPGRLPGGPPIGELVERYSALTGTDIRHFEWYEALAWFKLAVILAGVHDRASKGQAAGQEFAGVEGLIDPCVERGLDALDRCRPTPIY